MASETIYWKTGDQLLELQQKILDRWEGSPVNKALIRRFQTSLQASGTKAVRISKLTWGLRKLCDWLGKDLSTITKSELELLASKIHSSEYTEATKSDYKRCLKHFYRWYGEDDPRLESGSEAERREATKAYAYLKGSIKTSCKLKELDPGSIITESDIETVLRNGCKYDYERAFIKLLHETGCRVGEILSIRFKDVQQKETHWLIRVTGKTGERTIPIHASIPYLVRWLDYHPNKIPDSSLWISDNNRYKGQALRYSGAVKIVKRCFKRVGLIKKHNLHHFRHSRATLDAPLYSEQMLCNMRGWRVGSSMVRRYTHLSGKDAEDAFLRVKGLVKAENREDKIEVRNCICGAPNVPDGKFCYRCGKALSLDVALKEHQYMEKAFDLMAQIMSDPKLQEEFMRFKSTRQSEFTGGTKNERQP